MRRNAILAAPQALTDQIMKWVSREVAAYYRDRVGHMNASVAAAVKADNPKREVIRRPRSHSFSLDLSDLPAHYPIGRMTGQMPSVKVKLEAPQRLKGMGGGLVTFASWHPSPRTLRRVTLNLMPPWVEERRDVGGYEAYKRRLRSSLEHELRHMVQTLFADAMGVSQVGRKSGSGRREALQAGKTIPKMYGIPPRDPALDKLYAEIAHLEHLRDEVYSRSSPKGKEVREKLEQLKATTYYLDPVEFFPHVGNQQDDLLEDCGEGGTTHRLARTFITNECFHKFIKDGGSGGFLPALKAHAPSLHKRAVSEIGAWMLRHNEKAQRLRWRDAGKETRPVPTHRIIAEVQDDLDREDLVLATYLRQHRAEFLLYADREAQKL